MLATLTFESPAPAGSTSDVFGAAAEPTSVTVTVSAASPSPTVIGVPA